MKELYNHSKERILTVINLFEYHRKRKHKVNSILTNVLPVELGVSMTLGLNYKSILIMMLKEQWTSTHMYFFELQVLHLINNHSYFA